MSVTLSDPEKEPATDGFDRDAIDVPELVTKNPVLARRVEEVRMEREEDRIDQEEGRIHRFRTYYNRMHNRMMRGRRNHPYNRMHNRSR